MYRVLVALGTTGVHIILRKMYGLRNVAAIFVRFVKFMLVNIAFGWLMDFLIFERVNEAIDSFFTSMDEYGSGVVGVEAEGVTGGSSGENGRRGS